MNVRCCCSEDVWLVVTVHVWSRLQLVELPPYAGASVYMVLLVFFTTSWLNGIGLKYASGTLISCTLCADDPAGCDRPEERGTHHIAVGAHDSESFQALRQKINWFWTQYVFFHHWVLHILLVGERRWRTQLFGKKRVCIGLLMNRLQTQVINTINSLATTVDFWLLLMTHSWLHWFSSELLLTDLFSGSRNPEWTALKSSLSCSLSKHSVSLIM